MLKDRGISEKHFIKTTINVSIDSIFSNSSSINKKSARKEPSFVLRCPSVLELSGR